MSDELIVEMPRYRILPGTDFPARQVRPKLPRETVAVESRLARGRRTSPEDARYQLWTNLKLVSMDSGAIGAISDSIADTLLSL